jgi:hypothetical protein
LGDKLPEEVRDCFKFLEDNLKILSKIEMDLEDEKEDKLVPGMELHQLYDMANNVSEASKIKRAQYNLIRRQSDDFV